MRTCLAALVLIVAAIPADAQWLDRRTRGVPCTRDGKPNLTAPAPRSQTLFEGQGLGYQFIVDDKGAATAVVEIHISGPYQYERLH